MALAFSQQPAAATDRATGHDPAKIEFFEKRIRPLLVDNCYNCHSADSGGRGGLRVDDRNGLVEGGERGSAIRPGDPDGSLLLKAVRHQGGLEMPPKKQLSDEQIADLEKWIQDGAAWPPVDVPKDLTNPKPEYDRLRKEHWAWQPLVEPTVPHSADESFVFNDIDRFILSKLQQRGLKPVSDADKLSLIRRVTFDLTGLPPTPDEIAAFVADESPTAFESVVDRLLKSPAFGERWARHWLDVARYGESTGSARNLPMPHAWRYRDYVIDTFTNDKPYDQFIREQIAGDLLPATSVEEKAEQLIATGFLALGVKDVNQRFKVRFTMDNIDEQIDTVSRSILALTASCARCHDHKFDPIPTVDYYALAGIFHSSELCAGLRSKMGGGGFDYYDTALLLHVGLNSKPDHDAVEKIEQQKTLLAEATAEFEAIRGTAEGKVTNQNGVTKQQLARQKLNKAQRDLYILNDPAAYGPVAYGVRESKSIADTSVRIRGEAEQIGPTAPRGFLSLLTIPDQAKIKSGQSGRLELAEWLTSDQNPLTQRVIVNRIWQHLFYEGIVTSVDNFGVNGDRPSHPELLDYLARQFVRNRWSVKKLVRTIVLSHAYRLSAEVSPTNFAIDPGNRLVWRHNPRRLEAEEIRDAMLAIAGTLDRSRPKASPAKDLKVVEIQNNGAEAKRLRAEARKSLHRSLYLPLVRGVTPRALEVFDFAEQGMVTGRRDATTVPIQALYLLNDPFVRTQGLNLAERVCQDTQKPDSEGVSLAYQLTFGRAPTPSEIDRALAYLTDFESATKDQSAQDQAVADALSPAIATNSDGSASQAPSGNTAASPETQKKKQPDAPTEDDVIEIKDPKLAAWASFCQALLSSAEFRYLR